MERGLDSQLWHACAGGMVQLPTVGAKVIYFPQGHGEQAASSVDFPRSLGPAGTIPCRLTSLHFLADTETDEVYARLCLQPEGGEGGMRDGDLEVTGSGGTATGPGAGPGSGSGPGPGTSSSPPPPPEKPASFAKTLTQSDANNGGGFSVPRYCAETIFPPLDYTVDPPVQTVLAKDVHGATWRFRHIYRGTPRRHLLTTGWSNFVNQKKLVAGDAIVFLRSATGELCVGVRRSMRGNGAPGDAASWHSGARSSPGGRWEVKSADGGFAEFLGENGGAAGRATSASSFARNRARVTAKSVVEAASLAVAGHPFEVVYYPRASTAEFCVKAKAVKAALEQTWYTGMRFKMPFETEDSSRISWFMGTIAAVQPADPHFWPNSPWRVLQVTWDEPDLLQGVSRVSPWQVDLVSTLPMQLPPFALPKKNPRNSEYALQGMSMAAALGPISPWGLVEDIPAGMQEARQERFDGQLFPALRAKKGSVPVPAGMLLDQVYRQQERGGASAGTGTATAGGGGVVVQSHGLSLYTSVSSPGLQQQDWPGGFKTASTVSQVAAAPVTNGSSKTAPFLLFGQAIDLADKTGSSAARHQHDSFSTNGPGEVQNVSGDSVQARGGGYEVDHLHRLYSHAAVAAAAAGGPKWMKDQTLPALKEKADRFFFNSFSHCKVFKDSEEVGRTVDLAIFSNYDELFGRLASMFCMDKVELQKNLVYRNSEGSTLQVGYEPYRIFMQSVRRLTILPDATSCGS